MGCTENISFSIQEVGTFVQGYPQTHWYHKSGWLSHLHHCPGPLSGPGCLRSGWLGHFFMHPCVLNTHGHPRSGWDLALLGQHTTFLRHKNTQNQNGFALLYKKK